ncbi:MAG: hypothetical protein L6R42_009145 [Xanthoria sp. 1 TBL-2021]|nr:MAG: hypothetical protein L6R42_009145 [Xanthoria sp. 1 TBL-2021]
MDGDSHVVDVELPHSAQDDHCWCIADAIYDASGGIKMDRKTWCEQAPTAQTVPEFTPLDGTPADLGDCKVDLGANQAAPGKCPAGPDRAPTPATPQAPATNPNQAPANAAQPPPTGKKIKRTPEEEEIRNRHLDNIGPLFRMVGLVIPFSTVLKTNMVWQLTHGQSDEQPATPPKTPRRVRRAGAWW